MSVTDTITAETIIQSATVTTPFELLLCAWCPTVNLLHVIVLTFTTNLQGKLYDTHFTDKATEAPKVQFLIQVIWLQSG